MLTVLRERAVPMRNGKKQLYVKNFKLKKNCFYNYT